MEPRIDLRDLCFAPRSSNAISSRPCVRHGFVAAAALLALSLAAGPLNAQKDWPPDDAYNGTPQQYPQTQQYAYPQPPQSAYQQYPQPQYAQPAYPQPAYQAQTEPYAQQGYGQQLSQAQALNPDELTQLIAPIALYPDGLVAQILAASTYPAQVSAADQWLRSLGNAAPEQIAAGADAQSNWDPSVKALTAFPQVLAMLDGNLQWTTSLGNAYYNQPQDVLQTIQVMRERAEDAGNLQSTPQEQVSENQGAIDIAPTNPQVVYVPTYNPWDVYGQPVSPYPGFSWIGALGSFFGSSPVQFGLSFAMNAFTHTPWGFLGWGLDWLTHSVLFNHNSYASHSTSVADWGFPHGGPRNYPGVPQIDRGGNGFNRTPNGYGGVRNGYAPTYGRPTEQFNRGYGQGFGRPQPFGDARTAEGFNHGFPSRNEMQARPAPPTQEAYNRYPQAPGRPQQFENHEPSYGSRQPAYSGRTEQFGRQNYGSGFSNSARDGYAPRQGYGYANPAPAYRAPQNSYQNSYRGSGGGRTYDSFRGGEVARSQQSGGFHFFGSHNSSENSGKAPKTYRYGGGHSGWGGSGGWKTPKAPKESHFSGGHSGGGHEHSSHHR
jgi:hypothetical protein